MRLSITCCWILLVFGISSAVAAAAPESPTDLVVEKGKRELVFLRDGKPYRTFPIALGAVPEGPKVCEGDGKTPEGRYRIDARKADSGYHRSLRVSYPTDQDRARARARGCVPGGDIFIHGSPNRVPELLLWVYRWFKPDWTRGCIAVRNRDMDEIFSLVRPGTAIEIRP